MQGRYQVQRAMDAERKLHSETSYSEMDLNVVMAHILLKGLSSDKVLL